MAVIEATIPVPAFLSRNVAKGRYNNYYGSCEQVLVRASVAKRVAFDEYLELSLLGLLSGAWAMFLPSTLLSLVLSD